MLKLVFTLCLTALMHLSSFSQEYFEIIDNDSTEKNYERAEMHISILKDIDFQNVVDIGSGDLRFVLQLADHFNDRYFVFEDIDSSKCNWTNLHSKIELLKLQNVDTSKIRIQIGEMSSTNLPDTSCDLVIMAGLIHELESPEALFKDVKRILKKHGMLLISDAIYPDKPNPHPGCTRAYLSEDEFKKVINELPLNVIKKWNRVGIKSPSNGEYESRILLCTFI